MNRLLTAAAVLAFSATLVVAQEDAPAGEWLPPHHTEAISQVEKTIPPHFQTEEGEGNFFILNLGDVLIVATSEEAYADAVCALGGVPPEKHQCE